MTRLLLIGCACALASAGATAAGPAATVQVEGGAVAGTRDGGVRAYLAIPYAAPPTGALRLRPPAPVTPWTGVRAGDRYGPDCLAPAGPGGQPHDGQSQSEDCLYLNVWAPAPAGSTPRPVMVWIYGSGFRAGSAAMPSYGGAGLAHKGVVFVSFNYRMGALGFLAHPALAQESPHHVSGNYGVLDAVAALDWVRRNIARFGGDPNDITVFGQSSGSETTNILTASPLAHGLFQRAIGESGGAFGEREPKPMAEAEKAGLAFASSLGASIGSDLRALPAEAFVKGDPPRFEPVVDGWVLPQDVYDLYAEGRQNDVPMLVGSNADEGQLPRGLSAEAYAQAAHARYGAQAAAFLALFPSAGDADAPEARKRAMTALLGDFNSSTWATLQSRTGHAPIYQYRFEHAPPPRTGPAPGGPGPQGVFHGAEIPYALDTLDQTPRAWTADDRRLAERMSDTWVAFARTGDPNLAGAPAAWRPVKGEQPQIMRISTTLEREPRPGGRLLAGLSAFFYGPDGLFGARSPLGWVPARGRSSR